ncbi:barstar (barnase inhibitor) [Tamaricihabitans halophyticus]|uniref:Barstar (Barnase inhibitor) n=1 Tax=Tamaricihabitans halophyticus TaxID=1262583 RepID=A0A4R2R6A0_9PSEU|nr:barstar family protein [Tamaricihabitans halophyticus]TCP54875.1 barstar (barnase inhibitor) [Tamaricihabitans halophyticus]
MPADDQVDAVVDEVKARGAFPHVLDGSQVRDKVGALEAISAALSFPDYFGGNLDALYDCLRDLSWLQAGEHVLIWVGAEGLRAADPKAFSAIEGTLRDACEAANVARPLSVVFTD